MKNNIFFYFADLPPPSESFDKNTGTRIVTEYKINEDGKKVKVVKTYKTETRKVSKSIAKRKVTYSIGTENVTLSQNLSILPEYHTLVSFC